MLSELYFALPDRLNDPFDCRVDIIAALEIAISKSEEQLRQNLEKFRGLRFFGGVQTNLKKVGVCSFSIENDNPVMWSHYADGHRGVCLIYSIPGSFFHENKEQILGISEVIYSVSPLSDWFINWSKEGPYKLDSPEDYRDNFGIPLIKKALTVKAQEWEYEKECRIIRWTEGIQAVDKRYLKEVYFGLATPQNDITLVKKVLDQGGYDVALYQMKRSAKSDFGLEALEI
jgi:hypothetical protein